MRRIVTILAFPLLLMFTACGSVDRLSRPDAAPAAESRAGVAAARSDRVQEPEDKATPAPTATAVPRRKVEPTPTATPSPSPAPAKRATAALTERVPACSELLAEATEQFRSSMSAEARRGHGIDVVTLGCRTSNAIVSITVTQFSDQDDAERGDTLLRRTAPFAVKDRKLDLDRISADVVGGAILPDELGGVVTVGFRLGKITVAVTAQPVKYGQHVEDDTIALSSRLAAALA